MEYNNNLVYIFADFEYFDQHDLPMMHIIGLHGKNINCDWITAVAVLRQHCPLERVYELPDELKPLSMRELNRKEIGLLEAAILGCPWKN